MRDTVYWSIRIAGYAVGAAIAGLFLALALPDMLCANWHSTKYLTHILFTLFAGLALLALVSWPFQWLANRIPPLA
jgi:hypothetical protein